jgi:hypothetical protein
MVQDIKKTHKIKIQKKIVIFFIILYTDLI